MSRSVGVVVPAFDPDPDRLREYLVAVRESIDPATLRVELDTPTPEAVPDLPAWVRVNAVRRRRGKGGAITDGFATLDTDVLAFVDADGATPAASVADVLAPVRAGETAMAVGSRRHPDAHVASHQTFARRFLGDAFAWIARRLLDASLYDYQCGAKALTREAWEEVGPHLYEPGFAWDIELIAVAAGLDLSIAEVPVEWEDQPGSTVSPVRDTLDMGRGLLAARHRARLIRDDRLHRLLADDDGTALLDRETLGSRDGEREPR